MKKFIYILFCIFSISCGKYNEKIENALKLAGDNRSELEKVLQHYSLNPTDSLKLKAAEFLIENMPGHYTLEGTLINEYREKIYGDTTSPYLDKKILDISLSHVDWIRRASHKIEDVEQVKANFLVRHIDLSFEKLYSYPWLEDLPFNIFLEYILPYRFENERLDVWQDSLHIDPNVLKGFDNIGSPKYDALNTRNHLVYQGIKKHTTTQLSQKILKQNIYLDCHHIALQENSKSRAFSIPSTIYFIPHYANRNGYHYWNTIETSEFKNTNIVGAFERKTAKVYQKTYSQNCIPIPYKDEYIPEFFQNPFYKDVSNNYMHTANITVHPKEKIHQPIKHAYLCVFNNLTWAPIAMGEVNGSRAEFKNMGKKLVYLPVYYQKTKMQPLNFPFILNLKGEIKYLIPDTCTSQKISIKRKYPFNGGLHSYNKRLEKIIIEAANHPDFQDADTLLSNLNDSITYTQGEIKSNKKYQYYRISHPNQVDLSELSFFDSQGNILKGNINSSHIASFDKDPLTNASITQNNKIKIDFPGPTKISKIICLPRSDGNGIYPENEYELFYYGSNGWISLGRKIPANYYIEYDNVPAGALLWLHNHTTGIEERVFTYEKGEVRFW